MQGLVMLRKCFPLMFGCVCLLGTLPAALASIYDPEPSFCDAYATKAVSQHRTAQAASCNYTGLRWNDDFEGQKQWCHSAREDVARRETRARAEALLT